VDDGADDVVNSDDVVGLDEVTDDEGTPDCTAIGVDEVDEADGEVDEVALILEEIDVADGNDDVDDILCGELIGGLEGVEVGEAVSAPVGREAVGGDVGPGALVGLIVGAPVIANDGANDVVGSK